jgi:hypothetical protein
VGSRVLAIGSKCTKERLRQNAYPRAVWTDTSSSFSNTTADASISNYADKCPTKDEIKETRYHPQLPEPENDPRTPDSQNISNTSYII